MPMRTFPCSAMQSSLQPFAYQWSGPDFFSIMGGVPTRLMPGPGRPGTPQVPALSLLATRLFPVRAYPAHCLAVSLETVRRDGEGARCPAVTLISTVSTDPSGAVTRHLPFKARRMPKCERNGKTGRTRSPTAAIYDTYTQKANIKTIVYTPFDRRK